MSCTLSLDAEFDEWWGNQNVARMEWKALSCIVSLLACWGFVPIWSLIVKLSAINFNSGYDQASHDPSTSIDSNAQIDSSDEMATKVYSNIYNRTRLSSADMLSSANKTMKGHHFCFHWLGLFHRRYCTYWYTEDTVESIGRLWIHECPSVEDTRVGLHSVLPSNAT